MASLTVRNLDEATKAALKLRAVKHGRSMEEEVRVLIANAVDQSSRTGAELYAEIRKLVKIYGPLDIEIPKREASSLSPPDFSRWPKS
ncbi:MAG: FitA-like ribbon-helix-helix domain-containing protein [Acidobacteriaceae bacterium]